MTLRAASACADVTASCPVLRDRQQIWMQPPARTENLDPQQPAGRIEAEHEGRVLPGDHLMDQEHSDSADTNTAAPSRPTVTSPKTMCCHTSAESQSNLTTSPARSACRAGNTCWAWRG